MQTHNLVKDSKERYWLWQNKTCQFRISPLFKETVMQDTSQKQSSKTELHTCCLSPLDKLTACTDCDTQFAVIVLTCAWPTNQSLPTAFIYRQNWSGGKLGGQWWEGGGRAWGGTGGAARDGGGGRDLGVTDRDRSPGVRLCINLHKSPTRLERVNT